MFVRWSNLSIEAEEQRRELAPREERVRLSKMVRREGMQSWFRLRSGGSSSRGDPADAADGEDEPGRSSPAPSLQTSLF